MLSASIPYEQLTNYTYREIWIFQQINKTLLLHADGINFDIEYVVKLKSPEYYALTQLVYDATNLFHYHIPGSQVSALFLLLLLLLLLFLLFFFLFLFLFKLFFLFFLLLNRVFTSYVTWCGWSESPLWLVAKRFIIILLFLTVVSFGCWLWCHQCLKTRLGTVPRAPITTGRMAVSTWWILFTSNARSW